MPSRRWILKSLFKHEIGTLAAKAGHEFGTSGLHVQRFNAQLCCLLPYKSDTLWANTK